MPNIRTCLVCNTSLANRRVHAKTCSGYCRTKLSRARRAKPISIKLNLSRIEYNQLKSDADDLGLLVNRLMLDRAIKPFTNIGA